MTDRKKIVVPEGMLEAVVAVSIAFEAGRRNP